MESIVIVSLVVLLATISFLMRKIDLPGAIGGIFVALIIWLGSGNMVLLGLLIFFVSGTAATAWKKTFKSQLTLVEENDGQRGLPNVLANGGAAALFSLIALSFPWYENYLSVMALASLASVCSDTLSSELGNIYGSRYYDILTFKNGQRGKDGVISAEGLFFGIAGSSAIASCLFVDHGNWRLFLGVSIAGVIGNLIDSVLGATLQRQGYISNHRVNFIASVSGALSFLIYWILVF